MHGRTSELLLYKYKYIHPEFHKAHINSVLQQKYNDRSIGRLRDLKILGRYLILKRILWKIVFE